MYSCTTCNKQLDSKSVLICEEHCKKPFCWGCLNDHALVWMTQFEFNISKENEVLSPDRNNKHKSKSRKSDKQLNIRAENSNSNQDCLHPLMEKGRFLSSFDKKMNIDGKYAFSNFKFVTITNKKQTLGSGAFGDVVLAKHIEEDKKYAVKIMNKAKLIKNQVKLSDIEREIEVHSRLDHPYIIRLVSHHEDEENFYMILDYAKNGTLYSKMKKMKHGFSEETAFKYFIQTCSAIYFLHKNKLAHRDIKPENLLLDENNNIKVADFGWCDFFTKRNSRMSITNLTSESNTDGSNCFKDICGTYEYMAPEIVKEETYSEKVDIWSIGVLLYELIHGKSPFVDSSKDSNFQVLFSNIKKGKFEMNDNLTENCKDLIQSKY